MTSKPLMRALLCAPLFLASPALAQDAQTDAKDPQALLWSGRVNFGGFVTDGNTDKKAVVMDAIAKARNEKNRYTAGGEIRYAEDEGEETENEYMVYGEYDRFIDEKLFIGGHVSYETDKIAELDRRIKVGPYAGYQFFEGEQLNLSARLGVDYLNEEFENGDTDDSAALSWGLDYDQKVLDNSIQLFHKHNLSVPTNQTDAFLFDSETGIRFPIAKVLTGSAQIDFDWDNDPAAGVKEEDTKYSLKLGYEFN